MAAIMIIIGIVICVAVIVSIASAGLADVKQKEEAELRRQERRLSVTGYGSFGFTLKGSNYCSDTAKEFLRGINEGDAVVLMPEFFNEFDKYAISVRYLGKHIGYMDRTTAFHWAEKLFTGDEPNYRLCVATKVEQNEGYDTPLVEFEVYYKEPNGKARFNFKHDGPKYIYVNPVEGCGQDLTEDIAQRGFLLSEISREVVNTFPELYKDAKVDEELQEKWHEEDVQFLKQFIYELYTSGTNDARFKSHFLRKAEMDRVYGNGINLKILIESYLEFKELKLK